MERTVAHACSAIGMCFGAEANARVHVFIHAPANSITRSHRHTCALVDTCAMQRSVFGQRLRCTTVGRDHGRCYGGRRDPE
eukprot:9265926-Alexandrium_andersonii.AAC.1